MRKIYAILVVILILLLAAVVLVGLSKRPTVSNLQSAQAGATQQAKSSNADSAYRTAVAKLSKLPGLLNATQQRTRVLAQISAKSKELSALAKVVYDAAIAEAQREYESDLASAQTDGEKRAAERALQSAKVAAKKTYTVANNSAKTYLNGVKANIDSQYKIEVQRWTDSANRSKKELDIAYSTYKSAVAVAQKQFEMERNEAALDFAQQLEEIMEIAMKPDEMSDWTPSLGGDQIQELEKSASRPGVPVSKPDAGIKKDYGNTGYGNEGAPGGKPAKPKITSLSPRFGPLGTSVVIKGTGFTPSENKVTITCPNVSFGPPYSQPSDAGRIQMEIPNHNIPSDWYPIKCRIHVSNQNGTTAAKEFILTAP